MPASESSCPTSAIVPSECRMPVVSRPICRHSSTRTRLTRSATCMTFWRLNSAATGPPGAGTLIGCHTLTTTISTILDDSEEGLRHAGGGSPLLTPQTVTGQIKLLEQRLGGKLLIRKGAPLRPPSLANWYFAMRTRCSALLRDAGYRQLPQGRARSCSTSALQMHFQASCQPGAALRDPQ